MVAWAHTRSDVVVGGANSSPSHSAEIGVHTRARMPSQGTDSYWPLEHVIQARHRVSEVPKHGREINWSVLHVVQFTHTLSRRYSWNEQTPPIGDKDVVVVGMGVEVVVVDN